MHVNDIFNFVNIWLHSQKETPMPRRNVLVSLGKLQERGIIENKDGYCKVNRVGLW